jgi:hypothetical protein
MNLEVELKFQMAARFRLQAFKDGVLMRETGWFHNLITDAGLNYLGSATSSNALSYCHVGSGSAAPDELDTSLATFIASHSSGSSVATAQASSPYYGKRTITYTFSTGQAAGNISEVGIANSASSSDVGFAMWSRALVLDGDGDPTTITVLSDEQLVVTYELRYYPPTSDVTATVSINGDSYDITIRAANVTNVGYWANVIGGGSASTSTLNRIYDGAISAVTALPSGTSSEAATRTTNSYSNNSFQRSWTLVWGPGLTMDVTAMAWTTGIGCYQIGFSPAIPLANTQTLTLSTRVSWSRKDLS